MEAEERGWSHRGTSVRSRHPQRGYAGHSGWVFILPSISRDQTGWNQAFHSKKEKLCCNCPLNLELRWSAICPMASSDHVSSVLFIMPWFQEQSRSGTCFLPVFLHFGNGQPSCMDIGVSLECHTSLPKAARKKEAEIATYVRRFGSRTRHNSTIKSCHFFLGL